MQRRKDVQLGTAGRDRGRHQIREKPAWQGVVKRRRQLADRPVYIADVLRFGHLIHLEMYLDVSDEFYFSPYFQPVELVAELVGDDLTDRTARTRAQ